MSGKKYSPEFQRARKLAFARDDHACVRCGVTKGLHAHHLKPRDQGGSDEVDNLMTLCGDCHMEWELRVSGHMAFDDWLKMLPMNRILNFILHEEFWRGDIPASVIRKLFMGDVDDFTEAVTAMIQTAHLP